MRKNNKIAGLYSLRWLALLLRKELQHLVLIKLNVSSTATANIQGSSVESLHTARYRLRKKIDLAKDLSLDEVIFSFKRLFYTP